MLSKTFKLNLNYETKLYYQNKIIKFSLLVVFLGCVLSKNIFADTKSTTEDIKKLKTFINSGIDYVNKYGTKQAYTEFSDPKGKFQKGELYLFVYDLNGTCLAHGSMPQRVGKNFINELDKYGTPAVGLAIKVAKTGGGLFSYYWPEPGTNKVKLKTSYVEKLNDHTIIGAGLYKLIEIPQDQLLVKLEQVKTFINAGIEYFKEHGAQAAYKEFNNPNGSFRIGNMYLFVLNSKGVFLAIGADINNLVGKNSYNLKDEFGTPIVQLMIQIGKDGGGSVSYYWPEPSTKKIKLKVCYIMPLNNDTFIGSGFYGD